MDGQTGNGKHACTVHCSIIAGGEGGVCVHSREDECLCAFFASSVRTGYSVTEVPTKVVCIVHGLLARSCKPRGKVDEKVRTYYLPV